MALCLLFPTKWLNGLDVGASDNMAKSNPPISAITFLLPKLP